MTSPERQPVTAGAVIAERLGTTQEQAATCLCGTAFQQTRNAKLSGRLGAWQPDRCESCMAAQAAAAKRAAVEAAQQHARERRLAELAVPTRYGAASCDNYRCHGDDANRKLTNRVLIAVRRFAAEWPTPAVEQMIFRGGSGTGKGHLAWALARHLVGERAARVRFVKLPALVRDLREAWRGAGASESQRLRAYREPDLLIVDEVSRHAFYGEPTQHLYDVLDDRMDWCRPTILTTNESERGISELLGPALLDRFVGYGGLLDFGEVSYRCHRSATLQHEHQEGSV